MRQARTGRTRAAGRVLSSDLMSEPSGYDDTVLPERAADDSDLGWGEPAQPDDDDRLTREKPPHY